MEICEAVKIALETKAYIYRKSVNNKHFEIQAMIKPTNSYDCCYIAVIRNGKPQGGSRNWNPTADDLMADDWEVTTRESFQ